MPTVKNYQKQQEKQKVAYDYFISQGYSPEASAGIVGNLVYESGLNTSAEGDIGYSGGSSFGIAQFRGKRLQNLKKRYGDNWTDFGNQLDFVRHELETTHQKAGNILKNTRDVYQAGQTFSDLYEIPAKKYKDNKDRQSKVNKVYSSLSKTTYTPSVTPISDQAIANVNTYYDSVPTTAVKDLPNTEEIVNFEAEPEVEIAEKEVEDKDIQEVQKQTAEYNFLEEYKALVNQQNQNQQVLEEPIQEQQPQQNLTAIYNQVSEFIDTPIVAQQGLTIQDSKDFTQNWYKNRVLPDQELNTIYQNEKQQYINQSQYLPEPNYVDKIDDENTQGIYDNKTGNIDLLRTADPLVYTHEVGHKINLPLKDTQSNVNAFNVIGENVIPREKVKNQWVKDNYEQISNYQEVIPRLNSYRQLHGLKPDQVITPELIKQNRDKYNQGTIPFEDNTDQLYKLFQDEGLSNTLNKVVSTDNISNNYAQQGKLIENLKKDFGNKPKQMYLPEGSEAYKKYKEQDRYFNPVKREDITSGDWQQDMIYENDWVLDTPILGRYIKEQAKKVAIGSEAQPFLTPEQTEAAIKKDPTRKDYKGGNTKGATLVDQYFSDKALYPNAKYKPTSDYLEFLPTYSLKDKFEKSPEKQKVFNQELTNFMFQGNEKGYDEFLKTKKPVYRRAKDGSEIADLLDVDLGGHKTGAAWDEEINLPYVSVSDAWDFEPTAYAKKWDETSLSDKDEDRKANAERSFIQAYLMHKSGKPFKIYDRFYFDPKTKKYIPDAEIDKLRPKKQTGGIIKDNQGQRKHRGEITEIEGDTMATDGYGDLTLFVKPDIGAPRIIEANTGEHIFPNATKFTEYPLTENEKEFLKYISKNNG